MMGPVLPISSRAGCLAEDIFCSNKEAITPGGCRLFLMCVCACADRGEGVKFFLFVWIGSYMEEEAEGELLPFDSDDVLPLIKDWRDSGIGTWA